MEIKYEPVFGPQELFDGAPEDAEYAGWFCQEVRWYMILNGKILFSDGGSWCTSDNPYLSADIAAMRRIIRTPTWTVADRKAGKLPEVGAELLHESEGYVNFVGEFDFRWMIRTKEGCLYLAEKFYCSPIETPEEKSARLRDEWVEKAVGATPVYEISVHGYGTQLRIDISSIYDALLSGDLPMPSKDGE